MRNNGIWHQYQQYQRQWRKAAASIGSEAAKWRIS